MSQSEIRCKYPKESRSYRTCVMCSSKDICCSSEFKVKKLMFAHEAKKKAEDVISSKLSKELNEIAVKIDKAASSGEFSVCGEGTLHPLTVENLSKMGYVVKSQMNHNETYWCVKW